MFVILTCSSNMSVTALPQQANVGVEIFWFHITLRLSGGDIIQYLTPKSFQMNRWTWSRMIKWEADRFCEWNHYLTIISMHFDKHFNWPPLHYNSMVPSNLDVFVVDDLISTAQKFYGNNLLLEKKTEGWFIWNGSESLLCRTITQRVCTQRPWWGLTTLFSVCMHPSHGPMFLCFVYLISKIVHLARLSPASSIILWSFIFLLAHV